MGEYEPNDSRNITLSNDNAPGEPPRTGPREGETRANSQSRGQGEQGVRAAPQPGSASNEAHGGTGSAGGVDPLSNPQATQSQFQGGMAQTMGGMTQTLSGINQPIDSSSASHRSDDRAEQFGDAQPSPAAPSQREAAPSETGAGAAWAADFPPAAAEVASGHATEHLQDMHEGDSEAERKRREQAAGQGSPDVPQGLGYGAEDGEEMADAPDATERDYGGPGEQRLKKPDGES